MTVLKDISVLWTMLHTLVMFLFLFESRYPRKKMLLLTAYTMAPLIVLNLVLFVFMGLDPAKFGFAAFWAGAVTTAIPGIIVQLVLIPVLVLALDR